MTVCFKESEPFPSLHLLIVILNKFLLTDSGWHLTRHHVSPRYHMSVCNPLQANSRDCRQKDCVAKGLWRSKLGKQGQKSAWIKNKWMCGWRNVTYAHMSLSINYVHVWVLSLSSLDFHSGSEFTPRELSSSARGLETAGPPTCYGGQGLLLCWHNILQFYSEQIRESTEGKRAGEK